MSAQVALQSGFILHQRPYRESSLLLDVFTRDHGVIPVLARGVRKSKSKLAGVLQPFFMLQISYLDKNDLKLLTHAELQQAYALQRLALYCGFYVNELVQKLLHKHDPHPELFACYADCLYRLSTCSSVEATLRYFELDLLEHCGYGFDLSIDANSGAPVQTGWRYHYVPGMGIVTATEGFISGATLLTLAMREPLQAQMLPEAKQLSRRMLDSHLSGQVLKSREVLLAMFRYREFH